MTGSGTVGDPYIIYDVNDLQAMKDDHQAYYELANDIDATATSGWNGGAGFRPVGDTTSPFNGYLHGHDFCIFNLHINRPTTSYVGLFGLAGTEGGRTIQHFTLINCDITGLSHAGGIVGHGVSTQFTAVLAQGSVQGGDRTGLFAGEGVKAWRCYAQGTVGGGAPEHWQGGFVGVQSQTLALDCYARVTVLGSWKQGGFYGGITSTGRMNNCYSTGQAPCGFGYGDALDWWIETSFWDIESSGAATGICGLVVPHNPDLTGLTTAQAKTRTSYPASTWDFDTIWDISPDINDGYPYLRGVTAPPEACTNMVATAISDSQIDVTWTKGDGAVNTVVRRKVGAYPANVADGDEAYNGPSASFSDQGLDPSTAYYYRSWSYTDPHYANAYCQDNATTMALPPAILPPTVTTESANNIEQPLATVNGVLTNDGGEACDCWFEYAKVGDTIYTTAVQSGKTTGALFLADLTGLTPDTRYHFRAVAENSQGITYGANMYFVTESPALLEYSLLQPELAELLT